MQHMVEGENSLKMSAPQGVVKFVTKFQIESVSVLIKKVFVEQPRLHQVCEGKPYHRRPQI